MGTKWSSKSKRQGKARRKEEGERLLVSMVLNRVNWEVGVESSGERA